MKLINSDDFLNSLDNSKTYTKEELKKLLNERPTDYDVVKVVRRIGRFSGVVNQQHIFEIQDIVKDGGKSDSFFD